MYLNTVLLSGGGISGLCLGVALSRYPHIKVDVYEATGQFKEIGAGVMIWARTWRILELMGLAENFSKVAHAPPDGSMGVGFDYRRSDAPEEGFQFRLVQMPYGCIRFHRASFLDVFVDHLPPDLAHFGKRLLSYTDSGHAGRGVQLQFADGSSSECDILVGCDGIKSIIREQLYETKARETKNPRLLKHIKPLWTGTIAYRGLVEVEKLRKMGGQGHRAIKNPMMVCHPNRVAYCGKGRNKHVVSYSISQGNIVNVVTFASEPEKNGANYPDDIWVTECPQQELLDAYKNWEPEVERLLKCIDRPTRWAIHHLDPLPFYVSGRVALLGDAAHAMAPHQGAGAGQAIEDAYLLACLLGKATVYEKVRLPAANAVLEGSFESGKMYEFDSAHGAEYEILGPAIQAQWNWIGTTTVEQDVGAAMEYFMQIAPRSRL
ncbi:Salicylate hydroxylase [Leucoagaricus sp. SymC.cos]|nr:Salicylate hydroxylase [Leucoagaricus sp. SymC.cos]